MKRLSILAVAAAAVLSATTATAAPRKVIETELHVFTVDTYKSGTEAFGVLDNLLEGKAATGAEDKQVLYIASKKRLGDKELLDTLRKIGKIRGDFVETFTTRSGKAVPFEMSETHILADGAENGKAKSRALETGFYLDMTPTIAKDGQIELAYEQRITDMVGLNRMKVAEADLDLAKVHRSAQSGSERLDTDESLVFAGFQELGGETLFGKRHRIVVAVLKQSKS
jgi:hypothetical protein